MLCFASQNVLQFGATASVRPPVKQHDRRPDKPACLQVEIWSWTVPRGLPRNALTYGKGSVYAAKPGPFSKSTCFERTKRGRQSTTFSAENVYNTLEQTGKYPNETSSMLASQNALPGHANSLGICYGRVGPD